MEPRARAAEEVTQDGSRFRWRLVAGCVLLLGLAFTQSPGFIVPDTKLDLVVDPARFLGRALHLWDAEGAFGQLQNQAYGYLWPMGPFFLLGDLLDLPAWAVQRLWMALILCVAFTGAAALARAFRVRSDLACLAAGVAFALSPRMLTVIGTSSIEVWPSALAPWVLLPLVIGAERGSPRRAAALSALAVAMVGGVNAAATFAVIPLAAVWILTRAAGPRRRTMLVWWPVFVLMGTLWWLIPLFTLGAYSPAFLDFIENAPITTFPTTIFDALRGTSNWVAYVDAQSPAAMELLTEYALVLNGGMVVCGGLAGLVLRRTRHRRFLVLGLFTGLFLVTMGHLGSPQGLLAPQINDLLDGALAPLRNVHKFDPVIRVPLVLGLAFALDEVLARLRASRRSEGRTSDPISTRVLAGTCLLAVAVSTSPFVLSGVTDRSVAFRGVPDYWAQTADFLADLHDRSDDQGVALLLPGSSFGTYVWGEPKDEPMQSLATTPWAVRNAIPLTPAGNIRMLDRVEQQLARGEGGEAFTRYLARAGITHLVVRNDLVRGPGITDPVLVHQAVESSPGIRRIADFGPDIGGSAYIVGDLARALVNGGWQTTYPAVEVYEVDDAVGPASGVDTPTTVVGGPEDLLDLEDADLIGSAATILASDVPGGSRPTGPLVLTDGLRSVERNFGGLADATSATLGGGMDTSLAARTLDYRLEDHDRWTTRGRLRGAESVSATSSAAGAASTGGARPGRLPYAAIDGDPLTSWVSAPLTETPQSWQVDFDRQVDGTRLAITLGTSSGGEQLRLRSGDWVSPVLDFIPGETRRIEGPGTITRLEVEDASGKAGNQLDLAEVEIGDVTVTRELLMPDVPAGWGDPDAVVLRRLGDARSGCAEIDGDVRCRPAKVGSPEERSGFTRTFRLGAARTMDADLLVRPRGGPALTRLVQAGQAVAVETSGAALEDPRASATAMVDGDPGTTWLAPVNDVRPTVELRFLRPQRIRGIAAAVEPTTAARRPQSFQMTWPGGERLVELDDDGAARFPPISTARLTLQVIDAEPATDIDVGGSASAVPVGIGELAVQGVPFLPFAPSAGTRDLGCGSGPEIVTGGRTTRTAVTASPRSLLAGEPVPARLCGAGDLSLRAGENTVTVEAADAFTPERLVLGSASTQAATPKDVDPSTRTVTGSSTDYVVTQENGNPGWEAVSDGTEARSQVFDGWRRGWNVAGSDELTERFAPDTLYRAGLAAGLLTLLGLVVVALRPGRRQEHAAPVMESDRWEAPVLGLALGAGLLLAGWGGLVAGLGAVAVVSAVRRWLPGVEGWMIALSLLPAVLGYAVNPWQASSWAGSSAWPHYVAVFAVSAVAWWALSDRSEDRPERRPLNDIAGRSTSQ